MIYSSLTNYLIVNYIQTKCQILTFLGVGGIYLYHHSLPVTNTRTQFTTTQGAKVKIGSGGIWVSVVKILETYGPR